MLLLLLVQLYGLIYASAWETVPKNGTAVAAGESVTLYCKRNGAGNVGWLFVANQITNVSCGSPAAGYSTNNSAAGQCDLTFVSDAAKAGMYTCTNFTVATDHPTAEVVVLSNDSPDLTENLTTANAMKGDHLGLTCSMSFTASAGISPTLKWNYTDTGQDVQEDPSTPSGSFVSTSLVMKVPAGPAVAQATCYTEFSGNAYRTYSNTSKEFAGQYPPSNDTTDISSSNPDMCVGTVLNCSGKGYPPVTYKWTITENKQTASDESTYTLSMKGVFSCTCTVTNKYGSGVDTLVANVTDCSAETTTTAVDLNTSETTLPSTTKAGNGDSADSSSDTTYIIIIVVVVVVVGIGIGVIIILCVCYHKRGCRYHYNPSWHKYICCCFRQPPDKKKQSSESDGSGNVTLTDLPQEYDRSQPYLPSQRGPDVINGQSIPRDGYPPYSNPSSRNGYDNQAADPNAIVYAELQVNQPPRSRRPYVEPSNTDYAPIRMA